MVDVANISQYMYKKIFYDHLFLRLILWLLQMRTCDMISYSVGGNLYCHHHPRHHRHDRNHSHDYHDHRSTTHPINQSTINQ